MEVYNLILQNPSGGIFSTFNKLLNYFIELDNIYKITWNVYSQFYSDDECFSKIFKNYYNSDYENFEKKDIICDYNNNYRFTGVDAHYLYIPNGTEKYNVPNNWRIKINNYWKKYITLQDDIVSKFNEFKVFINSYEKTNIITMLIRHPDHGREQINNKQPSLEQFENKMNNLYDSNSLVICLTDSIEAYTYFSNKYNYIIFPDTERTYANETQPVILTCKRESKIKEGLLSTLYLTLGNHFIHSVSNMSTAVLYINPDIESHYLIG